MNLDETILLSQLTKDQKDSLKFWQPDMAKFVLVYPKKIFLFANKNILIVDDQNHPIIFEDKIEAYSMLQKIKCQD